MEDKRTKTVLISIILLLLFAISFLDLIEPISDSDFFWHIATGRWIVDNKALPEKDPFSYTTPNINTTREKFILTSYWLSQVSYYTLYYLFGYPGIMGLRVFIFLAIAYLIYKRSDIRGIPAIIYLPLILITMLIFSMNYKWERPQVFSFVFFGLLLYLFDEIKNGKRYSLYLVPPLMIIWANMHGGFILGQGVLFIYILNEIIRGLFSKKQLDKRIVMTSIIGIITGFINPNTYGAIRETLTTESTITVGITEYMSTIEFFKSTGALHIPIYWIILALSFIAVFYQIKRGIEIKDILLLSVFGYFSFKYVRYIAFFIIYAVPFIGVFLQSLRWKKAVSIATVSVSLILCIAAMIRYNTFMNIKNIDAFMSGNFVASFYPEESINFILENNPKERLYNYYDWGGYLIWRLYPEKAVFIDGRQLHENAYILSRAIDNVQKEPFIAGIPYWKAILKTYNINCILIPAFRRFGDIVPLFAELLQDNEWSPVFYYENSVVFVRRIPENYRITYIYSRPREFLVNYMINFVNSMIDRSPYLIGFHIAKGDLLEISGRLDEAEEAYKRALELFPLHRIALQRLQELEMYRRSRGY
jgi:hypothetical protein